MKNTSLYLGMIVILAACSTANQEVAETIDLRGDALLSTNYHCEQQDMQVVFQLETESAAVNYQGKFYMLKQQPSASGFIYQDEKSGLVLQGKGDLALLLKDDKVLLSNCVTK